jgi:hypothetical protein
MGNADKTFSPEISKEENIEGQMKVSCSLDIKEA